jgi:hypothetical protein
MREPLTTMMGGDDMPCAGEGANTLLEERLGRLDRVEVASRAGGSGPGSAPGDEATHARILMRPNTVECAWPQALDQALADPRDERLGGGGGPLGAQRDPHDRVTDVQHKRAAFVRWRRRIASLTGESRQPLIG